VVAVDDDLEGRDLDRGGVDERDERVRGVREA